MDGSSFHKCYKWINLMSYNQFIRLCKKYDHFLTWLHFSQKIWGFSFSFFLFVNKGFEAMTSMLRRSKQCREMALLEPLNLFVQWLFILISLYQQNLIPILPYFKLNKLPHPSCIAQCWYDFWLWDSFGQSCYRLHLFISVLNVVALCYCYCQTLSVAQVIYLNNVTICLSLGIHILVASPYPTQLPCFSYKLKKALDIYLQLQQIFNSLKLWNEVMMTSDISCAH